MKKLLFAILLISSPAYAAKTVQELTDECMARFEAQQEKRYETECNRYGERTECTTKEKSRGGYNPYVGLKSGECTEEALRIWASPDSPVFRDPNLGQAFEKSFSKGQGNRQGWTSVDGDTSGLVTFVRSGKDAFGRLCGEYDLTFFAPVGFPARSVTACRQGSSWTIVP